MATEAHVQQVETTATYSDGIAHPIIVADVGDESESLRFSLRSQGIQLVRGDERLRGWCDRYAASLADGSAILDDMEKQELASLLGDVILTTDARLTEGRSSGEGQPKWSLGNVILRQGGSSSYTRAVHRDLDETAVENFRTHSGLTRFYNAWVPLRPVLSDPLALLLPDSLAAADPASFLGYNPIDRTGLNFNSQHQWIFFSHLQPGDVLLWESEKVFHVSFPLPDQDQHSRASIDIRLYF